MSKTRLNSILLVFSSILIAFIFIIKSLVLFHIIECTDFINRVEYAVFIILSIPFYFIVLKYVSNKRAENKQLKQSLIDIEDLINHSALISKADAAGNITYVNQKFIEVSGYSKEELLGKNHNIVNSGYHDKDFWKEMYNTVVSEKKIWNGVITNKSKKDNLYFVDSYIKAKFDDSGKHVGFISIRQDVSDIIQLNDKLNSLLSSQTSYVVRTDMQGKHTYWNQKFEEEFGWVYKGDMMHGDSLLSICKSHHGAARNTVAECIAEPGKIIKVELDKPHIDGSRRTTLWEFVCLTDKKGQPTEIQCMGVDITDRVKAEKKIIEVLKEIERKNVYLEHAAKILRHDMHSGINTYIPRGVNSLERRLSPKVIQELKLEAPLRLIKDGLSHAQKVYSGVKEFTNLVKSDAVLNKSMHNLKDILRDYLEKTVYGKQVIIDELPTIMVNEPLFCTAIDNLIRNGLKYNDSATKFVHISIERNGTLLTLQDNGRGMTQKDFEHLSQPYTRKHGQNESGSGLGLNICVAILKEHGFSVSCEKNKIGTKMKIDLLK